MMMLGKLSDDSPLRKMHEEAVKSRVMSRLEEMVGNMSCDEIRSLLQDTKDSMVKVGMLMDALLAIPDEHLSEPEYIYNAIVSEIKDGNLLEKFI